MAGLLDFIQGASNAAASNISGPVDLLGMGLRGIGVPVPQNAFMGSQWMRERGLMRDPENRMAGLLGEAAGMSLPIAAAAKAPQIAQGLLQMGDNLAAPSPMNLATRGQGGALYFRRTNGTSPDTGAGHMMFAKNRDSISGYGENLHTFNDASAKASGAVVNADDRTFIAGVIRALKSDPDVVSEYGRESIKSLAKETNPEKIVNSAGLWDNLDLTSKIWERVLEPRGIQAVRTADGAVVFDPRLVKTRGLVPR
jgi:hypothetical protein